MTAGRLRNSTLRARQRAVASLMAILFLLTVIAAVLATALLMTSSDIMDSAVQNDSVQALLIAESGLERAVSRYTSGAATCNNTLMEGAIAFGRGNFEVVAPTPYVNGVLCVVRVRGTIGSVTRTIEAQISGGTAAIAFDRTERRARDNDTTFTWPHTVGAAGTNRLLIVGVSLRNPSGQTVSAVTYDGVSLTPIGAQNNGANVRVELWQLVAPATGNNQVRVTIAGASTAIVAGSASFTGANQAAPILASAFAAGTSNSASVTVPTGGSGLWVIDTLAKRNSDSAQVGAGQTERWNSQAGGGAAANRIRGAGSTWGPVAAANTTMAWSPLNSTQPWAHAAAVIQPAGGGQIVRWAEVVQ